MSIIDIRDYQPHDNSKIIFDTNILIEELWPVNYGNKKKDYACVWERIISSKAILLISSIQISEFINRCLRIQFDIYKSNDSQKKDLKFKKDYRETEDYKETVTAVLEIIENDILPRFTLVNDHFDEMDTKKLFSEGYSYDFNDAFLAELSRKENASVLTDDADFSNFAEKTNVITGNKFLLMMKK